MKICVLQTDYSTTQADLKNYEPPRNLSQWLPNDTVDHVFLNKLTTYQQLKQLKKAGYDIFINLCEGYLDWSVPSIDVIHSFELLNLPYTGPNAVLYDPAKPLMKYVAYSAGVKTPRFVEIQPCKDIAEQVRQLNFPLFVKPSKAGDSLGIDDASLVNDLPELSEKIKALQAADFDDILVEEYIAGREFTVLVAANSAQPGSCRSFTPIEYLFPKGKQFKTYALKTSELHTEANVPCGDLGLEQSLRRAAERVFTEFAGVGYGRMDFRVDPKGDIYFLEVNFACSVFYVNGSEGSADYVLLNDPIGHSGFLQHIIAEGLARHALKQKKYVVKNNSSNGYGIFANSLLKKGTVIFALEGKSQRIITRSYAEKHWSASQMEVFTQYAYSVSESVFILWADDPREWAPQNHSCQANTDYDGLNVIALRGIQPDEELTLDYSDVYDDYLKPFKCTCGSTLCRKTVCGTPHNSVTTREAKTRAYKKML